MVTHVIKDLGNCEIVCGFEVFRLRRYKPLNVAMVFFSPYFAFLSLGSLLIWVPQILVEDCSGLNPSSVPYWPCDLACVTESLCASIS